ncbi:ABC transporter permease [Mailhella massiliensis]|uniref:ABC transporter permease n=1 Tax=Mailhella massiliensis TaxID=1903261 RepID=UPI002352410F|nr:ABC transporter permease [Mailhella massiliensis]
MRIVKPLLFPFVLLCLWQFSAATGMVSPYLLPSPSQVLETGLFMAGNGALFSHIGASLSRIAAGFGLSMVLAFTAAGVLSRWKTLDECLQGSLSFLRMTPPLALTPLLILWLGIGDATQIAIIVLASFFPMYLNTRAGLNRLEAPFRELAASLGLSRMRTALFFLLPAATPSIVTGLRLSFGYSWRALIAAELIAAGSGLGYMIMDAEQMQRADEVIVGILVIGLLGWLFDAAFSFLVSALLSRRFPELAA